jgi:hypothetical protein
MNLLKSNGAACRLDLDAYRKLRDLVLARDAWKCQQCGTAEHLEVHHIRSRSSLGSDVEENLITLCGACHSEIHLLAEGRIRFQIVARRSRPLRRTRHPGHKLFARGPRSCVNCSDKSAHQSNWRTVSPRDFYGRRMEVTSRVFHRPLVTTSRRWSGTVIKRR